MVCCMRLLHKKKIKSKWLYVENYLGRMLIPQQAVASQENHFNSRMTSVSSMIQPVPVVIPSMFPSNVVRKL